MTPEQFQAARCGEGALMEGELHPEAGTNVSVSGFGPLRADVWCAILVHPSGHIMAAFYEPVFRERTRNTGFEWPPEARFRDAVRESARQLLGIAGLARAALRFGDETETVEYAREP